VCFAHSGRLASSFWSPPRGVLLKIEPTNSRRLRSRTRREAQQIPIPISTAPNESFTPIVERSPSPSYTEQTPALLVHIESTLSPHSTLSSPLTSIDSDDSESDLTLTTLEHNFRHLTLSPTSLTTSLTPTPSHTPSETLSATPPSAMATVMPLRGERIAPKFDNAEPNDLIRFFKQLEILFARCKIALDNEKKEYTTSYVSAEVADSWEAIPEFADANATFANFRDRLFEIYNQVSSRYILSDLDRLIGERQRLGMRSLQDLSEFHLRFNAMASYLETNHLISTREQSQSYLRVFDDTLQSRILMRLQIQFPNQHPSLPYAINKIYDAAKWVLQGVPGSFGAPLTAPLPLSLPVPLAPTIAPDAGYIKTEQLGSFLTEFTKTIVETLNANANRPRPYASNGPSGAGPPRNLKCMFDGCDRFIRDCEGVEEYIRQGKCRRNFEGKVVLSSGAYVPREIPGEYLRDRIDEWHRRNPNQLVTGTLSSNTTLFGAVVPNPSTYANTARIVPTPRVATEQNPIYHLSAQDRIAALEAEIFAINVRNPTFVPTIKTRRQREAERIAKKDGDRREEREEAPARAQTIEPPRIVEVPPPRRSRSPSNEPEPEAVQIDDLPSRVPVQAMPEHPFRAAKDATYVPRKVPEASKELPPVPKKSDTAYRTLPAIHDPDIAATVYNRALDTNLVISYHELLSLSPEVRSQVRDAVSSKRVPTKDNAKIVRANANIVQQEELTEEERSYLFADEELVPFEEEQRSQVPTFVNRTSIKTQPPEDAIIIDDPIDRYYRGLAPGETPKYDCLIVAKESSALRSIIPLIDNNMKVESILDPGCQIIAMSEDCCHELSLPYDPSIVVNMQSANGIVDPSLGLSRNVPFLIGPLTFYMQVHIIRSPAYDILLGRPFDVLTESVVRNFRNEDQTITVHDPNSKRVATIPTVRRGPPQILSKKKMVFHE
jgi:hypothetical protein